MTCSPVQQVRGSGVGGIGRVERRREHVERNRTTCDDLRAAAVQGGGQRGQPQVLEDDDGGRAAGFQNGPDIVDVVSSDDP